MLISVSVQCTPKPSKYGDIPVMRGYICQ